MDFRVIDVIGSLAAGMTLEEILSDFPYLEEDDIYAAYKYVTYILANFKPGTTSETL